MKKNMDKTFQQAINATLELTQLKQNMKLLQLKCDTNKNNFEEMIKELLNDNKKLSTELKKSLDTIAELTKRLGDMRRIDDVPIMKQQQKPVMKSQTNVDIQKPVNTLFIPPPPPMKDLKPPVISETDNDKQDQGELLPMLDMNMDDMSDIDELQSQELNEKLIDPPKKELTLPVLNMGGFRNIYNPQTGGYVKLLSDEGKQLLKYYVKMLSN